MNNIVKHRWISIVSY